MGSECGQGVASRGSLHFGLLSHGEEALEVKYSRGGRDFPLKILSIHVNSEY